ncbi:uncharacterized protein LOC122653724 [Telopea speciosissima]|uniref:uncharacterized protein LOC122653724 n=1 Tax=Telopea speciosissima TaxID=54955 RepID=UPI001CC61A7E|nr:uncharacterized protein LOC122653724 [Telopea speciosissima]
MDYDRDTDDDMKIESDSDGEIDKKTIQTVIILAATAIAIAVEKYSKIFLHKEPYRIQRLRGITETQLIIDGSERTCRNLIRLSKRAFYSLCDMLRQRGLLYDNKLVQVEEQVVIFLHTVGHNVKNRVVSHMFGHSRETISRYFNKVLDGIMKLYPLLLKPPSTTTHKRITSNGSRFYPYFKDCVGAIDGSHIPAWVQVEQHRSFRDRHGCISQNILAACDFDKKFTYILAGWAGSASDSRILDNTIHRVGEGRLVVSEGKFYLVDAGFPNQKGFLRPFRNVQYHKRFKILKNQPEYPFKTQVKIVNACVLLHNLCLTVNSYEEEESFFEAEEEEESTFNSASITVETDVESEDDDNVVQGIGNVEWDQFREGMADNMWGSWMGGGVDDDDMYNDLNGFDDVNDSD